MAQRLDELEPVERAREAGRQIEVHRSAMSTFAAVRSEAIRELIDRHGATETAKLLGISRQSVYRLRR